jgi:hypothetical protein
MKKLIILSLILANISGCVEDPPLSEVLDNGKTVQLFINEINSAGSPDWIEIYNPNNHNIDLEGFSIGDLEKTYIIPSELEIPANGFFVFLCDDLATEEHTNFKLSADGESVTLRDKDDKIVDQVSFPALNDGESYGRKTDGGIDFMVFKSPTQGTSNSVNENSPVFSNIIIEPTSPKPNDSISISVNILKADPAQVRFFYSTSSTSFNEVPLKRSVSDTTLFEAKIPPINKEATVNYYFLAASYHMDIKREPLGTLYYSFIVSSEAQEVFINEVLSTGSPDWMELYNATDNIIDLSGYFVYDDGSKDDKYKLPNGTTIPAKGFLALDCDDGNTGLKTNFKLSSGGESVYLEDKDGNLIEQFNFPALNDGESYGRKPDGSDNKMKFLNPTKGSSNG